MGKTDQFSVNDNYFAVLRVHSCNGYIDSAHCYVNIVKMMKFGIQISNPRPLKT